MAKQKVLLLGATGETGGDIFNGLVEDGNFEISLLVQPSSADKPAVKALSSQGYKIVIGDLSGPVDDLAAAITGYDTLISAISAVGQLSQLTLVDAVAKAGIKRFVPCAFTIVCPPKGVMTLRDSKQQVYERMWEQHVPYTIIDVGYWYQISWFRVPSGKFDYAILIKQTFCGDGEVKTLLTDKRDIGRYVARIIKDERTLNRFVFAWGDEISQYEVLKTIEEKTGEKAEYERLSEEQLRAQVVEAESLLEKGDQTSLTRAWIMRSTAQYSLATWIRADNTRAMGKYLGYLDAQELYPDFKPISFAEYIDELAAGTVTRPYESTLFQTLKKEGYASTE